jgi:hypothetical protein
MGALILAAGLLLAAFNRRVTSDAASAAGGASPRPQSTER